MMPYPNWIRFLTIAPLAIVLGIVGIAAIAVVVDRLRFPARYRFLLLPAPFHPIDVSADRMLGRLKAAAEAALHENPQDDNTLRYLIAIERAMNDRTHDAALALTALRMHLRRTVAKS